MAESAALFASTFVLVLALGLQSQFVNNGHYAMAFANSLMIGSANLVLFKLAPDASGIEIAAFICGGPFGIVTSMWLYRWFKSGPSSVGGILPQPYNYSPPVEPPPRRCGQVPKRTPSPDPNR
jgi:hypothetical protein